MPTGKKKRDRDDPSLFKSAPLIHVVGSAANASWSPSPAADSGENSLEATEGQPTPMQPAESEE